MVGEIEGWLYMNWVLFDDYIVCIDVGNVLLVMISGFVKCIVIE